MFRTLATRTLRSGWTPGGVAGLISHNGSRAATCSYSSWLATGVAGEQGSQTGFGSTAWRGSGAAAAAVAASLLAISGASLYTSPIEAASAHPSQPKVDFAEVKLMISDIIEKDTEKRGNGQSIAGTLVRLAWHASGTYSAYKCDGGSNGAHMRFPPECDWGANAGLRIARDFLEPIKAAFPDLSYADLWTLAGVTAIESMGGPEIRWRPGRTDSQKATTVPDGRLPDADRGTPGSTIAHIRKIFSRMGFNDREIVALMGAHCVGRCHPEASGYWGPWTNAETTFSNEYFVALLREKWTLKRVYDGKPWNGPEQYEDESGALMMLPADMFLLLDKDLRRIVEEYASNEDIFMKDFTKAFAKLLELGVPYEEPMSSVNLGVEGTIRWFRKLLRYKDN